MVAHTRPLSLDDVVFKALADPARWQLLDRLRAGNGQPLTKLCAHVKMTRHGWPAILSSLKSLLELGAPLGFSKLRFGQPCAEERWR
jgi:hypothetical protein